MGVSVELAAALTGLPAGPLGLLLDFDGTLAEIVLDPATAAARPGARAALERLLARPGARVGIVSGRALPDLAARLGPLPGVWLAGSHGAELRDPTGAVTPLVDPAAARPALEEWLAEARALEPGLRLEDKGQAVAVHTRGWPPERAAALETALLARARALEARAPVEALAGKAVLELRARGASKRLGAEALLARWDPVPAALLAAGDDTTDEDLFAAVLDRGGIAIKVGPGPTRAPWRVPDPAALERILSGLVGT